MKVIIPSAKIVGEGLQKLGKLPAVIYPLSKGIIFDYLIDQYKQDADTLRIICYEKAEKVHRRLTNYGICNIEIIDLPSLKDLGFSVYYGIKDIKGEVIINFADTIVFEKIEKLKSDAFYYAEEYFSDRWTFYNLNEGKITSIQDKQNNFEIESKLKKVFVGVFRFRNAELLSNCLEYSFQNPDNTISSFYQAIIRYSEVEPLTEVFTDNWFDIGHEDKYYNSSLEVKAREFNHISIDKNRGILRKSSDDVDKFIGEIKWYLKLPADIEYVRPRIFDYSTSYELPYISMEYYAYHTLHELFLYGDLTKKQWHSIFSRINFVLHDFQKYSVISSEIRDALENIYLNKTIQRLELLRSNDIFSKFFYRTISINGTEYKSLQEIEDILNDIIPEMLYDINSFCIIHGDLCFSNIMVDSNFSFIKVIDPRGKFGKYDIYGDQRYELAKLFHSVDGKYDYIIKDLIDISFDSINCEINYSVNDRKRDFDFCELFFNSFSELVDCDLKKIELIEALLFLSMIPLHGESINHQMAMLGTGLNILSRVIDICK